MSEGGPFRDAAGRKSISAARIAAFFEGPGHHVLTYVGHGDLWHPCMRSKKAIISHQPTLSSGQMGDGMLKPSYIFIFKSLVFIAMWHWRPQTALELSTAVVFATGPRSQAFCCGNRAQNQIADAFAMRLGSRMGAKPLLRVKWFVLFPQQAHLGLRIMMNMAFS